MIVYHLHPGLSDGKTSWKHIRDVAHRLPRERQKHFIHKFSSMERLRSFCTLADNARASCTTLSEDILKTIIQENGEIELSRHLLFILHQRLPSLRHRITEMKKENSYHLLDCLLKFPENDSRWVYLLSSSNNWSFLILFPSSFAS